MMNLGENYIILISLIISLKTNKFLQMDEAASYENL
jgi:hypothetical protein